MDLIEKTFHLRDVDLFHAMESSSLARLAAIADVVEVDADTVLHRKERAEPAFFLVVRGRVELVGEAGRMTRPRIEEGGHVGARALFTGSPSEVDVRAVEPSRLLRIGWSDFQDLVYGNPEIAIGLLVGLARHFRKVLV